MMAQFPKVSVIMPLYNKAPYVAYAIRSVLEQDYTDFELIICDDGSTDGSQEIVKSISDPRILFFQNEKNLGTPGNGNRCFDYCKTEYVLRMDADDVMPQGRIFKQINFLKLNKDVAVLGGYNQILHGKKVISVPCEEKNIRNEIYFTNPVSQPTAAFNLSLIKSKGIRYNENGPWIGEDWIFFHSVLTHFRIVNLPEVFNYYRLSESNISGARDEKYFDDIRAVYRHILKEFDFCHKDMDLQFLFRRQLPNGLLAPGIVERWKNYSENWKRYASEHENPSKKYLEEKIEKAWDYLFFQCVNDKVLLKEYRKYRRLSLSKWRYLISVYFKKR